jgi:AraC-like DNA-binding protein
MSPRTKESVRAWKPAVAGIREVLHARFTSHAYPLHTHDVWTLFIVDEGRIAYDLDRRDGHAEPSMVSILPPHVVHDGRPGAPDGYRKRVIYVETDALGEHLIGPAVDRPILRGGDLRRRVAALDNALRCPDDVFEAETRFAFVLDAVRASLGEAERAPDATASERLAGRLRDYIDAHAFEPITLAAAATEIGGGPTHVARAFSSAYGIAPHAYLLGRRLEAARVRILAGQPLADVAAEVGFYDQAHLTRRFASFLGVTPGRFARSGGGPMTLTPRPPRAGLARSAASVLARSG